MACRWLILADDLTGAADCAIAFGRRGHAAVVTWGEVGDASDRRLPVLAYDAASRGLAAEAAAGRHADALERLSGPGRLLFKKIDSTLRGQPAAEMAAALEQAEVWQRDHTYPNADLVDVLATAGIRGEKVTLGTVRGGDLRAMFARLAGEGDMIAVCDAETDRDLHLIAEASLPMSSATASSSTFFIGSAGFAGVG